MPRVDDATDYLLEHNLVRPEWIIAGELVIRSASSRNLNLRVEGPADAGCFLKQPDRLSHAAEQSLALEADFLEFCQTEPTLAPLLPYLPRLVHRDRARSLMALELLAGAAPLDHQRRAGTDMEASTDAGRRLGQGLSCLHRLFRISDGPLASRMDWLPRPVPWAFHACKPTPAVLSDLSPAGAEVIRILQSQPGLDARLEALASEWRATTVIHGDLKAANILVRPAGAVTGADERPPGLWLVDWEFVQVGDPAWDLAGVLHDTLVSWTGSMPQDPSLTPAAMFHQARQPLESLRPFLQAFWRGYRSAAGLGRDGSRALLERAVKFSAARLVVTAHELCAEMSRPAVQAVLLLQTAANVLVDPAAAQARLYRLPAPEDGDDV